MILSLKLQDLGQFSGSTDRCFLLSKEEEKLDNL